MPKHFLEDMVKNKRAKEDFREEPEPKREIQYVDTMEIETNYNPQKSRYLLWFVALVSVIFCFFAVSFLFSKAQIVVNPKTESVVLNESVLADKDSDANGMSFDLVVIPGQESKTIQVSGEKSVSTAATGSVLIFNAYSASPQRLDIDTRLVGSNGKLYKTQVATIVPGMNKNGTPGQVSVGIYAAEPGPDYNSSSTISFTIFGFKGTPKYSKFMAVSEKGTVISGGFIGQAPDISPTDQSTALSDMKTILQTDLVNKATAQIPDGFILFNNAVVVNTDDANMSSVYNPNNTATMTLTGTLYGIILSEAELTKKIATDNIQNYDGSDVYIPDIKNLTFSLSPASASGTQTGSTPVTSTTVITPTTNAPVVLPNTTANSLVDAQSINFNLSGTATIVWKLDENKFINDLLGKSKKDFTQILSQYPNINSATLNLSPFWKMSIPNQAKDVKVIVNYPQS
ncbi:MAG: hypothetical protein P4L63_00255 [Candidatus Pacebacteria bacterium]|nr:hypothetical protein [Candidatus Paceibacterota bacterium]